MAQLIITEKPDASLKIAEALADKKPIKKTHNGVPYYKLTHAGKEIIVGCAVGHLYNLTERKKSGLKYPNFDLVWMPSYIASKSAYYTKKYLDTLKELSKEADSFVVACDYDTEGSLIGWTCIHFIFNKNDAKRMVFSTLTKDELLDSYKNALPNLDFSQIKSGETRHFLDHFWGINSSKALTLAIKNAGLFKILSSGRVQSPTLMLLVRREEEIGNFVPKPYWQIFAYIKVKDDLLKAIHKEDKFWDEDLAKKIFGRCKGKKAIIKEIVKREYKTNSPAPFNITSLQTEAYKLFSMSPKQTLDIAQSLYLAAYISYPRTSSEKLPDKIDYRKILKSLSNIKDFESESKILLSKKTLRANEGKKTDPAHIAIYPTSTVPKDLSKLNARQKKLYCLIVRRFLAVFGEPAIRESSEISFDIGNEIFKVKGTRTLKEGWISLYKPYAKFQEVSLPLLKEGEVYNVDKFDLINDETKPPSRYTQGSIIAIMDKHGLGTRATRSQILQNLYDRSYIEDKTIKVTELGKAVAKALEKYVPDLVSEELTRHFEREMEQIQENEKTKEEILEEAKKVLVKILKRFKENEGKIGKELAEALKETRNKSNLIGKCPNCDGQLRITYSKNNKSYFIACNKYPECKTTFSLPKYAKPKATEKICVCGFPIVLMLRQKKGPYSFCINKDCFKKQEWLEKQANNT